jgi:hypothetical protein
MYMRTRKLRRSKLIVVETMLDHHVLRKSFHLTMRAAQRKAVRRLQGE